MKAVNEKEITGYYQVRDYKGNNITTLSPKELDVFMAAVNGFTDRKTIMYHGAKETLNFALKLYISAGFANYESMKEEEFKLIYPKVQNLKYVVSLLNKFRNISEDQAKSILFSISRNRALFSTFDYRDEEIELTKLIELFMMEDCPERDSAVKNLINEVEGLYPFL